MSFEKYHLNLEDILGEAPCFYIANTINSNVLIKDMVNVLLCTEDNL